MTRLITLICLLAVSMSAQTPTQTIATGTFVFLPQTIHPGACSDTIGVRAAGALPTDIGVANFSADPTKTIGYVPNIAVILLPYVTADQMNVKICNQATYDVTPARVLIVWKVIR